MMNQAVFLDRDGTMARDAHYCRCPEDFELFPNTAGGIRLLHQHRFEVIVITNQSGVGRGFLTEETLGRIHDKMQADLARQGARVDAIYYCPHHPEDDCDCRKPKTKLVQQAAREHDIDLGQSFVVGDLPMDIELGRAIGARTVLVTGSLSPAEIDRLKPDAVCSDVLEAARTIIGWTSGGANPA
ncbi:MAG: HAD family hydrolase [Chloroflexota bacterium]